MERPLGFAELCAGIESGVITEALACGTSAVVSPVIGIKTPDLELVVGDGTPAPRPANCVPTPTGIQFGTEPDLPAGCTASS